MYKAEALVLEGVRAGQNCGGLAGGGGVAAGGSRERSNPGGVVELGILLLDEAILVDLHVVETDDRVRVLGKRGDLPAPGDGVAVVEDVEGLGLDLRLAALAEVEGSLVGEGSSAQRDAGHVVDRVGDIDEVGGEGSGRDVEVVATALGTTTAAVVVGVLQQVAEVVDDRLGLVISQALAAGAIVARGARGAGSAVSSLGD